MGEPERTPQPMRSRRVRAAMPRLIRMALAAVAALAVVPATATAATPKTPPSGPPKPVQLRSGWEVRDVVDPPTPWRPANVPSAFEGVARAPQFGGTTKLYRLSFTAPDVEDYS